MNDSVAENLEAPDEGYTVAIKGENLSFVKTASNQQLLKIFSVLLGGDDASAPGVGDAAAAAMGQASTRQELESTPSTPTKSVAEFLGEVDASTNYDRIAAFCLYAREFMNMQTLSEDDLPGFFERAGRPVPKNLTRDVKKAVKRELIGRRHDDDDKLYVTETGRQMLLSENDET